MKSFKLCVLFLFAMFLCFGASAQENLKNNLKKHVYTLADDSLMGRASGSKYARIAEDYIIKELQNAGLKVMVYERPKKATGYIDEATAVPTSEVEVANEDTLNSRLIFAYVEGTDPSLKTEWIILGTSTYGYGYEVIDGHNIIHNGANNNLSGVSAGIELAKMFAKERSNKRSVGFVFSNIGYIKANYDYMADLLGKEISDIIKSSNNIKIVFRVTEIGRMPDAKINLYRSKNFTNFQEIMGSFEKSANFDTVTNFYYRKGEDFSEISLRQDYVWGDLFRWADEANTLKYDTMTQAVEWIKELVSTFANTEKINYVKKTYSYYSDINNPYLYFGISGMFGSNRHHYNQGTMTGKKSDASSTGVFVKWGITRGLGLFLEASYQQLDAYHHDGKFSSDAISIPLSIILGSEERDASAYVSFGAYYDYIFAGKLAKKDLSFSKFNHSEVGLQCGLHLRLHRMMFGYYTKYGLTNVMSKKAFGDMQSRTNFFRISYIF